MNAAYTDERPSAMTPAETYDLIANLRPAFTRAGARIYTALSSWDAGGHGRLYFQGRTGTHSISLDASWERAIAHATGFLANQRGE